MKKKQDMFKAVYACPPLMKKPQSDEKNGDGAEEDTAGGERPTYPGLFRKRSRESAPTECVYAGPDMMGYPKQGASMKRVYAGPEMMGRPKQDASMECVYAGPDMMDGQDPRNAQMMGEVYAGPDFFEQSSDDADGGKPTLRFCTECGAMLIEGAKFCHECGTPAGADATGVQPDATEKPAKSDESEKKKGLFRRPRGNTDELV